MTIDHLNLEGSVHTCRKKNAQLNKHVNVPISINQSINVFISPNAVRE